MTRPAIYDLEDNILGPWKSTDRVCEVCGDTIYQHRDCDFVLIDSVWERAGLCRLSNIHIGCFEKLSGQSLYRNDFATDADDINHLRLRYTDILCRKIPDAMGLHEVVDSFMRNTNPRVLSTIDLLAVLTATLSHREQYPHRSEWFGLVVEELRDRNKLIPGMIDGLE